MATTVTTEKLELEATIMALRENLKGYFKGTDIDFLTKTNVRRVGVANLNQPMRHYQRRNIGIVNEQVLLIGDVTIAKIQHSPKTIKLYDKTLTRSATMKEIKIGIESFIKRYLPGVTIVLLDSGSVNDINDATLLKGNAPRSIQNTHRRLTFLDEEIEAAMLNWQRGNVFWNTARRDIWNTARRDIPDLGAQRECDAETINLNELPF